MTNLQIAQLIPAQYRTEILLKNHFHKAEAINEFWDKDVQMLWFYWRNFIEPENPQYEYTIVDGTIVIQDQCKKCLGELKKKWAAIMPHLIELEQEANMLQQIK